MKSPTDLAAALARQWHNTATREKRLLNADAWPLTLSIGKPSASTMETRTAAVAEHVQRWRALDIGEVDFKPVNYRATGSAVELPLTWRLASPEQWLAACGERRAQTEYALLARILEHVDPGFHALLVRRRSLWRDLDADAVIRACSLAMQLQPGIAAQRPLRALAVAGIDSKFIERHRGLLTLLLDLRFDGQASVLGLETFLDAADSSDHWLLVVPLADDLLPFAQQRVRSRELRDTPLPAQHILLVENEQCRHQLPRLPGTIAVLGAGQDLAWLDGPWLRQRHVGYWGDIDTWGLTMLARARTALPQLRALLMEQQLFDRLASTYAVTEPTPADPLPATGLEAAEQALYRHLLDLPRGRLEQEFIPAARVHDALQTWIRAAAPPAQNDT